MASELITDCNQAECGAEGREDRNQDLPTFPLTPSISGPGWVLAAKHQTLIPLLLVVDLPTGLGVVVQVCNLSTGEVEAGGLPEVGNE